MTSSPIDISSAILSSAFNMQSYDIRVDNTEDKVSLQQQENLTLSEGGRDDIQLQRLGKIPVLKASKIYHDHQIPLTQLYSA